MNIALMAHDNKKELMVQFCTAYAGILSKHSLCATSITGKMIAEATGLPVHLFLARVHGGSEQIGARISYNEIDLVFYFRSTDPAKEPSEAETNLLRLCDVYNIPLATNIATAEVLVTALEAGSFNWREFVNPRSEYNLRKKNK